MEVFVEEGDPAKEASTSTAEGAWETQVARETEDDVVAVMDESLAYFPCKNILFLFFLIVPSQCKYNYTYICTYILFAMCISALSRLILPSPVMP